LDRRDVTKCTFRLTIEGDPKTGFHLAQDPDGFFTADAWFPTQQEAIEAASAEFGVAE
jgi:hypothetical protein